MSGDTVTVEYVVEATFANAHIEEEVEFDRAEWGAMTEKQREDAVKEHALGDNIDWSWRVVS